MIRFPKPIFEENPSRDNFGNSEIRLYKNWLEKNGKPWLPVMGEVHFSRVKREDWRDVLTKMRDAGIEIIASYVLWIYHEEEKDHFRFDGQRDLRAFVSLVRELGMKFFLRPGPWAHAECRNGGFPDWLLRECGADVRMTTEPYMRYVRRYYEKLRHELAGLDDAIIGIQVDNELLENPGHLRDLKNLMLEIGFHAPLFTATGWDGARLPQDALIPCYGGYPEAPWEQHTKPLGGSPNFFFSDQRAFGLVARALSEKLPKEDYIYPYFTCELGGGNQNTYHRRPLLSAKDILAMTICKLGSGMNMFGYYMFAGGNNLVGEFSTLNESRATGYANDCPSISYDFQAPIGAAGELRESYYKLSDIFRFVNQYGEKLAPMPAVMPDKMPFGLEDEETLRCAVRTDGKSGFLFINNHVRLKKLPAHRNAEFAIALANETLTVQLESIPSDEAFFIPFNLQLGKLSLRYVTAQPLFIDENSAVFRKIPGIEAFAVLSDGSKLSLSGKQTILGAELTLLEQQPMPTGFRKDKTLSAKKIPNQETFRYMQDLPFDDLTEEYLISIPEKTDYLSVSIPGNVAEAFSGGKLIADKFLDGTEWLIDVRGLSEIVLKVQPLTAGDDIYLEADPMATPLEIYTLIKE
ncbi:MAG: beta-galactosidase [Christensenellaceae bacterium]|nr:beta-galactosidase [Christensenellaceae bacterium]